MYDSRGSWPHKTLNDFTLFHRLGLLKHFQLFFRAFQYQAVLAAAGPILTRLSQNDDCDFQVKFEFVTVEMVGEAFEQVVKDQE